MGASVRPPTVVFIFCLQSCSGSMSPYIEEGREDRRSDINPMVFCFRHLYAFNSSLAFCSEYFNETIWGI